MYKVVTEDVSGVFVELVFLDAVLNFGQGTFAFAVFGFDTSLVFSRFVRR